MKTFSDYSTVVRHSLAYLSV